MAVRTLPDDPVGFIRKCLSRGKVFWTYHVNIRLGQRFISRNTIVGAEDYDLIEAYPDDKYLSSYLLLGRRGDASFHVLFGADVEGENVRVVTAYYPSLEEWEDDLKTRRIS